MTCVVCEIAKDFLYGMLTLGVAEGIFEAAAFATFFWEGIARIIGSLGLFGVAGLILIAFGYCAMRVGQWTRAYLGGDHEREKS